MVAVISYGANYGLRKTLPLIFGLLLGLTVMSLVVGTGLGLIIKTSIIVFSFLKIAGAMYLAYQGFIFFWHSAKKTDSISYKIPQKNNYFLIQNGVFLATLNPKTLFFFSSLFPLFIDPTRPPASQMLLLTTLLLTCTFSVHLLYVLLIRRMSHYLQSNQRIFNILTGLAFTLLAISIIIKPT